MKCLCLAVYCCGVNVIITYSHNFKYSIPVRARGVFADHVPTLVIGEWCSRMLHPENCSQSRPAENRCIGVQANLPTCPFAVNPAFENRAIYSWCPPRFILTLPYAFYRENDWNDVSTYLWRAKLAYIPRNQCHIPDVETYEHVAQLKDCIT